MRNRHHPTAVVDAGAEVAQNATLGCFVQVCSGSFIGEESVVEGLTIVPSYVRVHQFARVGHGVCFVAPLSEATMTIIDHGASIGAGAVIHAGVTIGEKAVIAPGSLVQKSIPAMAIVEGAPARIVGYVGTSRGDVASSTAAGSPPPASLVKGVQLYQMPRIEDIRGSLTVGEFERNVPFPVKRYFIVFDVPSLETRGEHAHRACHQFLICVRGSCALVADDGATRQEFTLDRPDVGIHLNPWVWGIQYKFSADAVLLVFASHYYDSADYVRDYTEFCRLTGALA